VTFLVLFVCICVLYYCHRVATKLQLIIYHKNIYTGCFRRNSKYFRRYGLFRINKFIQTCVQFSVGVKIQLFEVGLTLLDFVLWDG
jgi:hypothetical protein